MVGAVQLLKRMILGQVEICRHDYLWTEKMQRNIF